MVSRSKQNKSVLLEDEIDLTPYIQRLVKRKWWLIGSVIIACVAGYFGSFMLPRKYQVNAFLDFHGQIEKDGKRLVSSSTVIGMVDQFKNQISTNEKPKNEIADMLVEGKDYPLVVKFIVFRNDNPSNYPDRLIEYLNQNTYIKNVIEERRDYLSDRISNYNELIAKVKDEIEILEEATTKDGNCSRQSIAERYSTLSELESEKAALQHELDNLIGFVYTVEPYLINNGRPIYPNKVKNTMVIGVSTLLFVGTLVVFVKEKKR